MDQSILVKRVRVSDIVITAAIYAAASLSILLLAGIVCYTFVKGDFQHQLAVFDDSSQQPEGNLRNCGKSVKYVVYCCYYAGYCHTHRRGIGHLSE